MNTQLRAEKRDRHTKTLSQLTVIKKKYRLIPNSQIALEETF